MTAPMVVTNWINMQYHASTVDNQRYGSGNKVLRHTPLRLSVFIEAPREAIDRVMATHDIV